MSRLLALIDDYKDRHGQPSDSSIGRVIGVAPQTISSWRNRGYKEPMDMEVLRKLADLLAVDFETVVLRAVLLDVGWIKESDGDDGSNRAAPIAT